MQQNFEYSLKHALEHEGGWSDHPHDPGGATMKGVTLKTFRRYYGQDKTKRDLKNITDEQLKHIYKDGYWNSCKCDFLPSGVDYAVFDAAINSGPGRSARWMQGAVNAVEDGAIGPNTLAKVANHNSKIIINEMLDRRLRFMQSLSTWKTFGKGWSRRVEGVRETALNLAASNKQESTFKEKFEKSLELERIESSNSFFNVNVVKKIMDYFKK